MTQSAQTPYVGHRILEAMHSATRYTDAIFSEIRAAMPPAAARILDFGAGDGAFVDRFGMSGLAVDCVEPDAHLRVLLRAKAATVFTDIAEVETAAVDFAYTVNVLEHIAGVDHACAEPRRALRPAGRLFVFVPALEVLWTSLDDEVGHVRRFSRATLRAPLTRAGFAIEQLRFFDSIGFPAGLGVRLLEKVGLFRYGGASVGVYDRYLFPISRELDRVLNRMVGKNLIAVARKAP